MDFKESRFATPAGELCLRRFGQSGPRILGLHGWMDHAGTYDRLAPFLADYEFVALDFSGHGRSAPRPPGAFYHFADWAQEVSLALEFLEWERFCLVGHSMGAGVGTLVAGAFPERVERFVAIEGLGPLTDPPEKAPGLLKRSLTYKLVGEPPCYPSLEAAVERLERRGITKEAAQALASRMTEEVEGGIRFTVDPRLRIPSRSRLSEQQVLAFLKDIAAPTLLILGGNGVRFSEEKMAGRKQAVPNLTEVSLPGGHHLHLDDPEPVAQQVREFIPV